MRYSAASQRTGGRGLKLHKDETALTFNLCLSPVDGFTGGGTYFPASSSEVDGLLVRPGPGHALVHDGNIRHAGNEVTSGNRFILVGFYNADGRDRAGEEAYFSKKAIEEQRAAMLATPPPPAHAIFFNTAAPAPPPDTAADDADGDGCHGRLLKRPQLSIDLGTANASSSSAAAASSASSAASSSSSSSSSTPTHRPLLQTPAAEPPSSKAGGGWGGGWGASDRDAQARERKGSSYAQLGGNASGGVEPCAQSDGLPHSASTSRGKLASSRDEIAPPRRSGPHAAREHAAPAPAPGSHAVRRMIECLVLRTEGTGSYS